MRRSVGSIIGVLLSALVIAAGCGEQDETPALPAASDPGPVHVHGLGVNPVDGALFIATHSGLFRVPEGEQRARRVADRYQDTMGFTVVGPDRFLGSGHPDGREQLPPFLGLIESTDAGQSWRPLSLQGEADFHQLEAGGKRVYGYGSDWESREEQLLVSDDGGSSWSGRPAPEPLVSLTLSPRDRDALVAAGERSLYRSRDGARTWERLGPGTGLVAWAPSGKLYRVAPDGTVSEASSAGRNWHRRGQIGGEPAAFEAAGDSLYAALHDGSVKRSTDGGRSWTLRSRP